VSRWASHPRARLAAGAAVLALGAAVAAPGAAADNVPADFTVAPDPPAAGQSAVLSLTPETRANGVAAALWDLNADGVFDALGDPLSTVFAAPGPTLVRLRVIDDAGDIATVTRIVAVGAPGPPPPPAPPPPPPPPGLMTPFPVVRLQGRVSRGGTVVTRLTVHAPAGARVRGVCLGRGRGCPRRSVVRRSRSPHAGVRLRALERRLRPGAVIQVYVTAPDAIGKYTRFSVRRGEAPFRRDLCVAPAGVVPARCPGE